MTETLKSYSAEHPDRSNGRTPTIELNEWDSLKQDDFVSDQSAMTTERSGSEDLNKRPEIKQVLYEERHQVALEAMEARKDYNPIRNRFESDKDMLDQLQYKVESLTANKRRLEVEVEDRLRQLSVRVKSILNVPDKPAQSLEFSKQQIGEEIQQLVDEIDNLHVRIQQDRDLLDEIISPEEVIQSYKSKAETEPLSTEDKRELLRPEFLSDLSLEEYMALWRKLNPYFMAHVTRHGIKDKASFHVGGAGEFNDGATAILENKGLTSLAGSESGLDAIIERGEHYGRGMIEREAIMNYFTSYGEPPIYADLVSVHFSAQEVLDDLYGGESHNQVFFIYPSDYLASQHMYTFHGYEGFGDRPESGENKWNDTFIYSNNKDEVNIPIDAGLVFLPKSTKVDPRTGSRYIIKKSVNHKGVEAGIPVIDEDRVQTIQDWLDDASNQERLIAIYREAEDRNKYNFIGKLEEFVNRCSALLDPMIETETDRTQIARFIYQSFEPSLGESKPLSVDVGSLARSGGWVESSIFWERPKNTIEAQEYWESYFTEHPEQRPKHIVYYDGDPTKAVKDFLARYSIYTNQSDPDKDKFLGFEDNHLSDYYKDPRVFKNIEALIAKIQNRTIREVAVQGGDTPV